jgi:hypothetical protein
MKNVQLRVNLVQVHLSICFLGFHVKTKPFPPSFPLLFHDKYGEPFHMT